MDCVGTIPQQGRTPVLWRMERSRGDGTSRRLERLLQRQRREHPPNHAFICRTLLRLRSSEEGTRQDRSYSCVGISSRSPPRPFTQRTVSLVRVYECCRERWLASSLQPRHIRWYEGLTLKILVWPAGTTTDRSIDRRISCERDWRRRRRNRSTRASRMPR